MWLIKVWFFASTFVVEIATFAKRQTVRRNAISDTTNIQQTSQTDKKD
ncbi:MAG: hypothetical protein HC787_09115 [Nostocaceae cyanobacterium CSU_2_110]|nr:hypothetical protein [Nostocaceae cyanobacterium CSU_2_110]